MLHVALRNSLSIFLFEPNGYAVLLSIAINREFQDCASPRFAGI